MEFKHLKTLLKENFAEMVKDAEHLFQVSLDKDELYNLYLDSFPDGTNKIFRERRAHDCSSCKNFIRAIGNVVLLKDGVVHTIWGFKTGSEIYQPVMDVMDAFVKSKAISDVYLSPFKNIGTDFNFEDTGAPNGPARWEHFHLELPKKFVVARSVDLNERMGQLRDARNVFKRSLDEISVEAVETVLELIAQNSLYKGEEWKAALNAFLDLKKRYELTDPELRENFAWEESVKLIPAVAKIKNTSIGTLLVDISNNVELDKAVSSYEKITAPSNYKRPKAIYTKKMLEDAQKTVTELGYMESLGRRHATLDDISVNNILFANRDAAKRIQGSVFDEMAEGLPVNPKKFGKIEEILISDFITNVLPTASAIEALVEGVHIPNFVSLIAPQNSSAPSMFKWGNSFSWAYTGNMTDSLMKERVKAAGGKVDGDLRFSIQWNDRGDHDKNDLDAHCITSDGTMIYYAEKHDRVTKGELDVDIQNPHLNVPAVENITWASRRTMKPGTYKFFVRNFAHRGGKEGFRAEIEFDGQVFSFDYPNELRNKEDVPVAEVTLHADGTFTIKETLTAALSSKEVWGVKTNQFVPVSVVMYSPNYWDEQEGIGHRHYFFMLKGCVNDESPNGFYNEFLKNDLNKHKRVFEALGSKMSVAGVNDQLSGLGFSATKRASLIVKVKGASERTLKILF